VAEYAYAFVPVCACIGCMGVSITGNMGLYLQVCSVMMGFLMGVSEKY
jgi:hypothetical protein